MGKIIKYLDMKNIIFILTIAALLGVFSCNSKKENNNKDLRIIDVAGNIGRGRVVNLSEIASEILYIPLESNDKSLLGPPFNKIYFEKGIFYYFQHRGVIFKFDKRGNFINQFNRLGRGPHEYEYFNNLQIDNLNDKLYIKTSNKIIEYKPDGTFIKTINIIGSKDLAGYKCSFALKLNENLFVLPSSPIIASNSGYSVAAIDSSLNVKLQVKYPDQEKEFVKTLKRSYGLENIQIYKFNNSVRIIHGTNEYILGINKDLQVDTSYIFNYGKYNINNADLEMRFNNNLPYICRFAAIYESDKYLFMQFHLGSLTYKPREMLKGGEQGAIGKTYKVPISCSLFNKKTGEFTFVDQPDINQEGFVDDFEGGPAIWPLYISEDGYMVSSIQATDFMSYAEKASVSDKFKQIASKLKENDNPVLVLVKLKK